MSSRSTKVDPASSGLQQLLLLFPGALVKQNAATTDFQPLVKTGTNTGTLMVKDVMASRNDPAELRRMGRRTDKGNVRVGGAHHRQAENRRTIRRTIRRRESETR